MSKQKLINEKLREFDTVEQNAEDSREVDDWLENTLRDMYEAGKEAKAQEVVELVEGMKKEGSLIAGTLTHEEYKKNTILTDIINHLTNK